MFKKGGKLPRLGLRYPGIRVVLHDLVNIDMTGKVSTSRNRFALSRP
ncbi:MAG: hypothetical protein ABJH63_21125 [Rhizobiaceae bacterium]